MNCSDCKYVRNCETTPDTNADECETFVKIRKEKNNDRIRKTDCRNKSRMFRRF